MATSNFRIKKICEWCGKEFEAQKVSTRFCSHRCANFAYKRAIRKKRVQTTESQTQVQKTERIIEDIKEKEYLSFSETGRLLGLSRQAIYTMVKAGIDIWLLLFQTVKGMTDQPGLSHTTGCYQCHVASIVESFENSSGLLLPVAKEFWAVISRNKKRIIRLHTISIIPLQIYRNANIAIKHKMIK